MTSDAAGGGTDNTVRLFDWNGSNWVTRYKEDGFWDTQYWGHSIAMSSDGTRMAIGTPFNDSNGRGFVEIYAFWPVSIDEPAIDDFTVYPNPTSGLIEIRGIDDGLVCLYDMHGKVLIKPAGLPVRLDISHLPQGVYFLKVSSKESSLVKQIIKQPY
jgi:hypothetical protein